MITQRLPNAAPPTLQDEGLTTESFAPGNQLLGKYTIVRVVGRGGMGVVVAARHNRLGEIHALKFLLPGAVADRQTLGRFEREAQAAAKLRGEHAVRVHDVGYTDAKQPYMVMEYFEGQNLRTILRGGPLPIAEAVEYLLQVCDALTEVHCAGIVHRDVKPANLLLTMRPTGTLCVKLLDFGIAKFVGADKSVEPDIDLTCDSMIGSLRYMSPEHIASTKSVDPRTDLWALGVTAYELLTGKTPFAGNTRMDIMSNILDKAKKPDPLRILRPDCPPALEAIVMRCLEKDRSVRFQVAADIATALREAMGLPTPLLAPKRSPGPSLPSLPFANPMMPIAEPERRPDVGITSVPFRPRPNRWKMGFLAGAFVCMTVWLLGSSAAENSPEEPKNGAVVEPAPNTSAAIGSNAEKPPKIAESPDAGMDAGQTDSGGPLAIASASVKPPDTARLRKNSKQVAVGALIPSASNSSILPPRPDDPNK